MPRVLYICNREKCPDCSYPLCYQTTDIRYAKHFLNFDEDLYVEKEVVIMAEIETTVNNAVDIYKMNNAVDIYKTDEIDNNMTKDAEVYNNMERKMTKKPLTEEQKANRRFWNFLEMVYKLAWISGLYIEGHIKVRDKKTGKVWE